MSDKARICPVLEEFAGYPGFPDRGELRLEEYWKTNYRVEEFRKGLDETTRLFAMKFGEGCNAKHVRFMAAKDALRSWRYDPIAEPDTPPAREEEIR